MQQIHISAECAGGSRPLTGNENESMSQQAYRVSLQCAITRHTTLTTLLADSSKLFGKYLHDIFTSHVRLLSGRLMIDILGRQSCQGDYMGHSPVGSSSQWAWLTAAVLDRRLA